MNANRQPPKKVRRQPRQRNKPYQGIVVEMSLKLILSWVIAIGAIASVFKLLPYHLSQQSKLKELRFQVEETNARVDKLRDELHHNFDPQQTQNLKEQYSSLTSPNQSRIYWLEKNQKGNKK
jgi:cell division protein FtsB